MILDTMLMSTLFCKYGVTDVESFMGEEWRKQRPIRGDSYIISYISGRAEKSDIVAYHKNSDLFNMLVNTFSFKDFYIHSPALMDAISQYELHLFKPRSLVNVQAAFETQTPPSIDFTYCVRDVEYWRNEPIRLSDVLARFNITNPVTVTHKCTYGLGVTDTTIVLMEGKDAAEAFLRDNPGSYVLVK